MLTLILAIALAGPADLAPSPRDVVEALAVQHRLTTRATALSTATYRLQNAVGRRLSTGSDCSDPETAALAARAATFGAAWRDVLQSARAWQGVLEERAASPTAAPLLPPSVREDISALGAVITRDAERYAEAAAWQRSYVGPRCAATLSAAPGLISDTDDLRPTAIVVLPGATLCPQGTPSTGGPIVVDPPLACAVPADRACDCRPVQVAPGAVLAPIGDGEE
jgi:hypothetical protein